MKTKNIKYSLLILLALVLSFTVSVSLSAAETYDSLMGKGAEAFTSGQSTRALSYYQRAARAAPQDAESHYQIASVYLALGAKKYARSAIEQTLSVNPAHIGSLLQLAKLQADERKFSEAQQTYEQVLQLSEEPMAYLGLSSVLVSLGDMQGAEEASVRYNELTAIILE